MVHGLAGSSPPARAPPSQAAPRTSRAPPCRPRRAGTPSRRAGRSAAIARPASATSRQIDDPVRRLRTQVHDHESEPVRSGPAPGEQALRRCGCPATRSTRTSRPDAVPHRRAARPTAGGTSRPDRASSGSATRRLRKTGTKTARPSCWPSCHKVRPGSVATATAYAFARSAGANVAGGPRLVVVLQEPHQALLVCRVGVQVGAHRADVALLQAVVQPFVVAVVEAQLLQVPLTVPVRLGDEPETRVLVARTAAMTSVQYVCSCGRPARSPHVARHDVVEHQHRHVTAHRVGVRRDGGQRRGGQPSKARGEGVDLHDIGPGRKVRVLAPARTPRPRCGRMPWGHGPGRRPCRATKASGAPCSHDESGPTWLGTQSTMSKAPRWRSCARAASRPAQPPNCRVRLVLADAVRRTGDIGV